MYKNDIIKFASDQIVQVPIKDMSETMKHERKQGDLSRWFKDGDTIEFDDSAEAFMSIKQTANILECFSIVKLRVTRSGTEVNLKKEPFHCVSMINKCLMGFFVMGS